ncbi:RidA family protein [Pseudonocardia sp. NPDC049635]|uniref:RidA family protein n=1 Tax=Pseudonocardia sp. NPDC049635 TaxID=3155506 RepID=UPI0033F68C2A
MLTVWNDESLGQSPGFSRAVEPGPGRLLMLSGQVSTDGQANPIHVGDMAGQARRCLEKISLLLAAAGGGMEHVALMRFYVTDMRRMSEVTAVRAEFFPGPVYPAMTGVGVVSLAHPDFLLEVEAVAVVPA